MGIKLNLKRKKKIMLSVIPQDSNNNRNIDVMFGVLGPISQQELSHISKGNFISKDPRSRKNKYTKEYKAANRLSQEFNSSMSDQRGSGFVGIYSKFINDQNKKVKPPTNLRLWKPEQK